MIWSEELKPKKMMSYLQMPAWSEKNIGWSEKNIGWSEEIDQSNMLCAKDIYSSFLQQQSFF